MDNAKKTIFVVDDNDTNLTSAKNALSGSYRVYTLASAQGMFKLLGKITPDLILLDVAMPDMDGYTAIKLLKADEKLKYIPVIFLTASSDVESEVKGFELGAVDFVTKPFSAPVLLKHLEMHLSVDELIKRRTGQLQTLQNGIISVISELVEGRDKVTDGHIERTEKYISLLMDAMINSGVYKDELKAWDKSVAVASAQLHDIGKIFVSDLLLNKPGKLTAEEFALIKAHPIEGVKLIDKISEKIDDDNDFLRYARNFALYHHERWDGGGYPEGLSGQNIPLQGRIMAVADVYDALISERPYKKPYDHGTSVKIISEESGKAFDPAIVNVFMEIADEFHVLNNKHDDSSKKVDGL